jgi:hypothetical protein
MVNWTVLTVCAHLFFHCLVVNWTVLFTVCAPCPYLRGLALVGGELQLFMSLLVVPLTFGKLEPFLVDVPSMLCPRFVKKQDHFLHCVPTCSAPDVVPGVGGDALDDQDHFLQ